MIQPDFHFQSGGKFISRGKGRHVTRKISNMELIFVISGTLGMFEEEQQFTLHSGDFLFLYPERKHGGTIPYPANLTFFWGHFTGDPEKLAVFPQSGHAARADVMGNYFAQLLTEQNIPENQTSCDLLLALLLHETKRSAGAEQNAAHRLAESAKQFIKLRFADPISTAVIAEELHCNADYLGRIFKQRFQCAITDHLNRVRLHHAAKLLQSGYVSIKEAAYASGFSDMTYFRKRFLREYAMRPAEYRKQRIANHINTE